MSIFVDENTKVVVQGISPTSQGLYHGLRNRAYGTQVVAGTNPNRGGEVIEGIPVYATVAEAVEATGANASFISVPPKFAAAAIVEAAAAGVPFVVCITEGIPAQDEALDRVEINSPIVLRLDGTNAVAGREILASHLSDRLVAEPTMLDAARRAVALAGGQS